MFRLIILTAALLTLGFQAQAAVKWNNSNSSADIKKSIQTKVEDFDNWKKAKAQKPVSPINRDMSLVLWDFSPDIKICSRQRTRLTTVKPGAFDSTVYGYKWPERSIGAPRFFRDNALIMNTVLAMKPDSLEANEFLNILLERLLVAANREAFTNPDFEGPGGSSPTFIQTIIVRNVSLAVSMLRQRSKLNLNDPNFKKIEQWVYQVMSTMEERGTSRDHKASSYVSQMSWGAASSNRELFEEGRRRFTKFLSKPKRNLELGDGLRNNNEVMHTALFGAYLLQINGNVGYELPVGNATLDKAVYAHAGVILETRDKKVKTRGDLKDPARSIFRRTGFGTHLAWIPIYLSSPGSSSTQEAVKALHKAVSLADSSEYFGTYIGLHSGCMFAFEMDMRPNTNTNSVIANQSKSALPQILDFYNNADFDQRSCLIRTIGSADLWVMFKSNAKLPSKRLEERRKEAYEKCSIN
jgi:hypothetical protein